MISDELFEQELRELSKVGPIDHCAKEVWKKIKTTETGAGISYGEIYQIIKKHIQAILDSEPKGEKAKTPLHEACRAFARFQKSQSPSPPVIEPIEDKGCKNPDCEDGRVPHIGSWVSKPCPDCNGAKAQKGGRVKFILFPYRLLFRLVWDFSEWQKIGLGRFAPFVFEQMTGFKGGKK